MRNDKWTSVNRLNTLNRENYVSESEFMFVLVWRDTRLMSGEACDVSTFPNLLDTKVRPILDFHQSSLHGVKTKDNFV